MSSDTISLYDAVEKIREQHFSDLPASLIRAILECETECQANRPAALKEIEKLIGEHLSLEGE